MSIYVGINNSSKQISDIYVGMNNSKKIVSDAYISKGGVLKSVYKRGGSETITASGTFTVPNGVRKIDVFMVGAGGGGGYYTNNDYAGGGGGGYTKTIKGISVNPGDRFSVTIGQGTKSRAGGSTASGGQTGDGGKAGSSTGGDGGCGGVTGGCNGGSDGSNGLTRTGYTSCGKGQGSTTRAFGEIDGTLYAGGGGGIYCRNNIGIGNILQGSGGEGGGGYAGFSCYTDGGEFYSKASNGKDGTGGGGGGAVSLITANVIPSTKGGSGLVIVRW